jgi:hypothetical protein
MRSLPSVLRSLTQATLATGTLPERTRARRLGAVEDTLVHGWEGALARLELERMETLVRRLRGRPPRIENPFAAFPTRSFWLSKLMEDSG